MFMCKRARETVDRVTEEEWAREKIYRKRNTQEHTNDQQPCYFQTRTFSYSVVFPLAWRSPFHILAFICARSLVRTLLRKAGNKRFLHIFIEKKKCLDNENVDNLFPWVCYCWIVWKEQTATPPPSVRRTEPSTNVELWKKHFDA